MSLSEERFIEIADPVIRTFHEHGGLIVKELLDALRTAAKESAELAAPKWVSVADALPDVDTEVLCYFGGHCPLEVGSYNGYREKPVGSLPAGHVWQSSNEAVRDWDADPIHWMPLPTPPESTQLKG